MGALDHIVINTQHLAAGTAQLEAALGVALQPGGQHAAMGTHNTLLSLGPDDYLEVIAIDPEGTAPDQPRWYDLDRFRGAPRLCHWAVRVPDLDAALSAAPPGLGTPWALRRGDLAWRMAVPADGTLPFAGLMPALLSWDSPHPAPKLVDRDVRLERLSLHSPDAAALRSAISRLLDDPRITVLDAAEPALVAHLTTPSGPIQIGPGGIGTLT